MKNLFLYVCMFLMNTLTAEINVLALAGSTQKDSLNVQLIQEAVKIAQDQKMKVTVIYLQDFSIPMYTPDFEREHGMPSDVKKLRNLFLKNDAVILATPEFNGSLPGLLKNVIDWVSRTESGQGSREPFKDKIYAIMSASPGGTGGSKALVHLRNILDVLGAQVVELQVSVPYANKVFYKNNPSKDAVKEELKKEITQISSFFYQLHQNVNLRTCLESSIG